MQKTIFKKSIEPAEKNGSQKALEAEFWDEHLKRFIAELTRGATPQEAARHSEQFLNTPLNYLVEKSRHVNPWS